VSGALGDKTWGIKNTSDNGIDIITKPKYGDYAAKGGWYGYEIKTSRTGSAPPLSNLQEKGAADFMKIRINKLANGLDNFSPNRVNSADVAMAKVIEASQNGAPYEGDIVRITNFGNKKVNAEITDWRAPLTTSPAVSSQTANQPKPVTKPKRK
jgi:hypothetical protein